MAAISFDKEEDRRVARTRAALAGALFGLLQKHDLADIRIKQLCDTADVARSSFYLHYASVPDLLDDLIRESFDNRLGSVMTQGSVLDWLVDHVSQNRTLFQKAVNGGRSSALLERFKAGFAEALMSEYEAAGFVVSDDQLHFIVGGAFEVLKRWGARWQLSKLAQVKQAVRDMERGVLGAALN